MSTIDHLGESIEDLEHDIEVMKKYKEAFESDIKEIDERIDECKEDIEDFKRAIDILDAREPEPKNNNNEIVDPFECGYIELGGKKLWEENLQLVIVPEHKQHRIKHHKWNPEK